MNNLIEQTPNAQITSAQTKIKPVKSVAKKTKPRSTFISVVATLFGAVIFIALIFSFLVATFYKPVENATLALPAGDVQELRVFAEDADFELVYADVDEVALQVTKSSRGWKLERLDDVIFVHQKPFIGICLDGCSVEMVKMIVPNTLKGANLNLTTHGGSAEIVGDFNHVQLLATNTSVQLAGKAETVSVSLYGKTQIDTNNLVVKDPAGVVTE